MLKLMSKTLTRWKSQETNPGPLKYYGQFTVFRPGVPKKDLPIAFKSVIKMELNQSLHTLTIH